MRHCGELYVCEGQALVLGISIARGRPCFFHNPIPQKRGGGEIQQVTLKDSYGTNHYGLTDNELAFIINYDIKYRMGRESGEEA